MYLKTCIPISKNLEKISFIYAIIFDNVSMSFDLVSLFNGISTFGGYLMPKPSLLKNSSGTI